MTKLEQLQLAEKASDCITDMETVLMKNIAGYLAKGNSDIPTAQWKIRMLAELGGLDKVNLDTITSFAGVQGGLWHEALEVAALSALTELEPGFKKLVRDGIINGTKVPMSDTALRTVSYYESQALDRLNKVNTVMKYKAKSAAVNIINKTAELADKKDFLDILNASAGNAVTGAMSRQAAMRQCIKDMAEKGIPAFTDKAGREWTPEAYVNMDIRTTASNVAHKAQFDRMDDYGIDLIEVSSHAGARPKCANDQGKIFNRNGKGGSTEDLYGNKVTYYAWSESSYGAPDGLLGINCGHFVYPFIPGMSVQRYFPYDKDENDALYKEKQKQRYLERKVRESKNECLMLKELGDKEGLKAAKARLKQRNAAYADYCESTGLSQKKDRLSVTYTGKKTLTSDVDSSIIKSNNVTGAVDVHNIGKIDIKKYSVVSKDITTDEVIITENQINHIKERHPNDYERFYKYIPQILEYPDYIIEANKPDTAVVLKQVTEDNEHFQLVLRLKTSLEPQGHKNSIITFMKIKEKEWDRLLRNKNILYKSE